MRYSKKVYRWVMIHRLFLCMVLLLLLGWSLVGLLLRLGAHAPARTSGAAMGAVTLALSGLFFASPVRFFLFVWPPCTLLRLLPEKWFTKAYECAKEEAVGAPQCLTRGVTLPYASFVQARYEGVRQERARRMKKRRR